MQTDALYVVREPRCALRGVLIPSPILNRTGLLCNWPLHKVDEEECQLYLQCVRSTPQPALARLQLRMGDDIVGGPSHAMVPVCGWGRSQGFWWPFEP